MSTSKGLLLLCLMCWLGQPLLAQTNLIVNGDLEEHYNHLTKGNAFYKDDSVKGLIEPNMGTTDYYYIIPNDPLIAKDVQKPFSGNAYLGACMLGEPHYREYIQLSLTDSLNQGCTYHLTFAISISDKAFYGIDHIAAHFSDTLIHTYDTKVLPLTEDAITKDSVAMTSRKWKVVSMDYVAKGGEKFMVVGNFNDNRHTKQVLSLSMIGKEGFDKWGAYYLFDNFKLVKTKCPTVKKAPAPEKATPVKEKPPIATTKAPKPIKTDSAIAAKTDSVKADSTFVLENVEFDFASARLRPSSEATLNHLYHYLKQHIKIHILIGGHSDNNGIESHNLLFSQQRADAVKKWLVKKGIDPKRIVTKGYGSKKPLIDEDTDEARQKNRRIEVTILKK